MKSGLLVMKHLITMSTDYLKRRGDKVTVYAGTRSPEIRM